VPFASVVKAFGFAAAVLLDSEGRLDNEARHSSGQTAWGHVLLRSTHRISTRGPIGWLTMMRDRASGATNPWRLTVRAPAA